MPDDASVRELADHVVWDRKTLKVVWNKPFASFMTPEFQDLLSDIEEFASRLRPARVRGKEKIGGAGSRKNAAATKAGAGSQKIGAGITLASRAGSQKIGAAAMAGAGTTLASGGAMISSEQAFFVVDKFCKKFLSARRKEQNTTVDLLESALFEIRLWFAVNSE